jgi:nucleotide-binding universal stress UspA family protein
MYKKILVTLDRSRLSEAVLPAVQKLLDGSPAQVTLFTVGGTPRATRRRRGGPARPTPLASGTLGPFTEGILEAAPPRYAESRDQAVDRSQHELLGYLQGLSVFIQERGSTVDVVARLGEPAREIIDFAREESFDLIVMATHGRSGLSELVQGSVAEAVVKSGVTPVLLVRPRKA